jgi:hypothetical protein
VDRGVPFERIIAHALHARYLIVSWRMANEWVLLSEVLLGAVSDSNDVTKLAGIEVNLSKGIHCPEDPTYSSAAAKEEHQKKLTWCNSNKNAHHDAYLWCRGGNVSAEDKLGYPVPIQLRHGTPKTMQELADTQQMQQSKGKGSKSIAGVLLVVNQCDQELDGPSMIAVNGSEMSICSWLFLMTPRAPGSPGHVAAPR